MKDPSVVRLFQCAGNLERQPHRLFDGQRAFERIAVHIFEDQIVRADVVELADMPGSVRPRRGLRS